MMINMKKIFLSKLFLMMSASALAQTCYEANLTATTPTARFTIHQNGMVEDTMSGLMWLRCSLGQTWEESTSSCTGNAEQVTWQQALLAAKSATDGSFSDWHLPNIKEMATLVERQCVDPAINPTLFPQALSENYWTNTSDENQPEHAWAFAFYSGKNNLKNKQADVFVRFVRYAK